MPLDQFFTEVEAQSCPSDASCTRIPSTDKWPEEARLLFIWNPHALIANAKTSFVRREAFLKRDIDEASKRTVLEGIGEQVRKDLFDPEGVDGCPQVGESGLERHAVFARGDLELRDDLPGESNEVSRAELEVKLPCLYPCDVQQILGEFC